MLKKLYGTYAREGVGFFFINAADPSDQAVQWLKKDKLPYTILVDPDATVAKRLGVSVIPATFVVDAGRVVYYHKVGSLNGIEKTMKRLIEKK